MKTYTEQSNNAYALRQKIRNDKGIYEARIVRYVCYQTVPVGVPEDENVEENPAQFMEVADFPEEKKALEYYKTFITMQRQRTDGKQSRMIIHRLIKDQMLLAEF
jgi:hypothetical protein